MSSQRKQYPFTEFEPKWQQRWAECGAYRAPNPGDPDFDPSKPKYYVLDMFPYPSGEGLHVGHPEGYTATDIVARHRRMRGYNVLHPMGWDAFGLPAEQYAVKTGQHPAVTTARNVERFKAQLQRIGFSYDWSREVNTTSPDYVRWTQWIFLQIYNAWFNPETNRAEPISTYPGSDPDNVRLAYVAEVPVNWCPALGTVLANEEVVDGKSEVGDFPVERRPMRQWMLRITAYAERLMSGLDRLDWPESVKLLQRNWIGRSEGALVDFTLEKSGGRLTVYTTRPDTLFGATYMVLAPEHPLVTELTTAAQKNAVEAYIAKAASKSDRDRQDASKEKTGVFTGAYAINPVNGTHIPVWIADYVLTGYGTGAIMAVPAHDERDHEFARKFDLPIIEVVRPPEPEEGCFTGEGTAVNSGVLDGLPTAEAKRKITAWLEERGLGRAAVQYKLRDWLFSRQRYWGEPFPVVWENGRHRALDDSELPVHLPELEDFKPTGTADPPLSKAKDWVKYSESATRELNTMPQWAGSCWYYLRFCDPRNEQRFIGEAAARYWLGDGKQTPGSVDLYVGGTEHAVLHLLYSRFWHMVLHDLGHLPTPEPFQRLVNQGIILGSDGQKMSKSRGNVVNPDEVINDYGADAFRLYEMFMGPLEQMKPWSMKGVEGVYRFLARVWRLAMTENQEGQWQLSDALADIPPNPAQLRVLHATIKKVTDDIGTLSFNTAISQMMVCVNELTSSDKRPVSALRTLLVLLSPFAPHMTEELWEQLGKKFGGFDGSAHAQPWPTHDEALLVQNDVEIVLQINGKVREKLVVAKDATREQLEAAAREHDKFSAHLADKEIIKVVAVPGKLVNFVVKG
ncbi:MAG: leucine--tRNA ligase [Chthoniobacterales bacterium]|nr:leucine--tRNA ligase [Chthoniobacterales bacterium]